jgi:hypothetical protein
VNFSAQARNVYFFTSQDFVQVFHDSHPRYFRSGSTVVEFSGPGQTPKGQRSALPRADFVGNCITENGGLQDFMRTKSRDGRRTAKKINGQISGQPKPIPE